MNTMLLSLLFACAPQQPAPSLPDLRPDAEAIVATGVVGVQLEVAREGDSSWAAAGLADLEGARPVERGDRLRVASSTKTFVAATVLSLADEQALGLDDPVSAWLPELEGTDGITVRHLLQHRSGLANYVDDLVAMLMEADSPEQVTEILQRSWTPEELVALAMAHPRAPLGEFLYADTNYVLLGSIIEAASGQRWPQALSSRVLEPLHLQDSYVPGAELTIEGPHMRGYSWLPGSEALQDVTEISPSSLSAAAALVSTPGDTNRFFGALLRGDLLSEAMLAEMQDVQPTGGPQYGLGLASLPLPCGGSYFLHDGDTLGYHTRTGATALAQVAVALTGEGDFEDLVRAIIERELCD